MSEPRTRASAVLEYLDERRQAMVELVVRLSSQESPTDVRASQEAVQRLLIERLKALGYRSRIVRGYGGAGHLFAAPSARTSGEPAQLLLGHSDTVWPLGTAESMPVAVEDGVVRGPGTFDMKAGLVQGLFALEALDALGYSPPATPVWFVNTDEEIGSPSSKRYVCRIARCVARTFVLEPSLGPTGKLKTARKGVGRFRIAIRGKEAHAGLDPTGGASAILELARLVERLDALTDLERGTTVNVGVVRGGTRPNVIAGRAEAEVDVRVLTVVAGEEVERAIRALEPVTPGTSLAVDGGMEVPPLERTPRNRRLWEAASVAGERLGIALEEETAGGGSDGNTTSQYTATLDGLGAVGDGAHARHEHVVIAELPRRAALLAELLMAPLDTSS
jgi:glutamate carboxypeptidase